MNHPIASAAVPSAWAGKSSAPVSDAKTMLYAAITMSWSIPSVPIPRILPASSCRARIVASRISTTREAFSSITPVATQTP